MAGIERYLGHTLFTADFTNPQTTAASYTRKTARGDSNEKLFEEKWLRDAIASNPEVVLAPCRAAGLIDQGEEWRYWKKEVYVPDAGDIDVLLVSRAGRVAIVETKLAYNPEARRTVVAQILEYAINFSSIPKLPELPKDLRLDEQDVRQQKDYLLIIAGDQLDHRAVKLSQDLLGQHSLCPWALALVEVAVFEQNGTSSGEKAHLLVPHIRGTVVPVERQVVKIRIKGDPTKIHVTASAPVETGWSEERFFAKAKTIDQRLRQFAEELRKLCDEYRDELSLSFGRGITPSVTLLRGGYGILTFQIDGSGSLTFNPPRFSDALGELQGRYYFEKLEELFPQGVKKNWASVKLHRETAKRDLDAVLGLLREVLRNSSTQAHLETAAS